MYHGGRVPEGLPENRIEIADTADDTVYINTHRTNTPLNDVRLLYLNIDLTRAKFDQLTAKLVEGTIEPMKKAMSDAGVSNSDIEKVILVGGSTRIPAVQDAVKKITGKDPFKGINPDECVAIGASIQAGVLTGEVNDVLLLDVTPQSTRIYKSTTKAVKQRQPCE